MKKMIIDLQKQILNDDSNVLSILRSAHIIASKLELKEFDKYIMNELNGYENLDEIPQYREVIGQIKALNPVYGLIPVIMSEKNEKMLNCRKIFNPISEIIDYLKSDKLPCFQFPNEISEALCSSIETVYPCYFVIEPASLNKIIESVKTKILEWLIGLEKNVVINLNSSEEEMNKNNNINNYYGPVFNSDIYSSNIDINTTNNNYERMDSFIEEIKTSLKEDKITEKQIIEIKEILDGIKDDIQKQKKKSVIKNALIGLKDFLIGIGASITANMMSSGINSFF